MGNLIPLRNDIITLPIDSVNESDFQLRVYYSEEKLLELAASLEAEGMFYPLLVCDRDEGSYELIAGSRRLRAAKLKGYTEIPAILINVNDPVHSLKIALTENLQREDLDPFEESRGFLRLMYEYGMSQKQVAESLNITRQFVFNRLNLLALPEIVQEKIATGELGLQFVPILVKLPTGEEQTFYATLATENDLNTAELREAIAKNCKVQFRVKTKGISVEKLVARIAIQQRWFKRIPSKIHFKSMTATECSRVEKELQELETIIRTTRVMIGVPEQSVEKIAMVENNRDRFSRNHRQQWTLHEIKKICASDRPSDVVLSTELGRTTAAIATMRSKMKG